MAPPTHQCSPMNTYELLLLVGNQLGNFIFASGQLFFVVSEVTYNEFLFACMELELFDDLLEKGHIEQCELLILSNQLRWTWHNHVGDLLIVLSPIVGIGSVDQKTRDKFGFDLCRMLFGVWIWLTLERWPTTWSNIPNPRWNAPFSPDQPSYESTNCHWNTKNENNE